MGPCPGLDNAAGASAMTSHDPPLAIQGQGRCPRHTHIADLPNQALWTMDHNRFHKCGSHLNDGIEGLHKCWVKGLHENLDILPVASVSPNPTEIFASPQMREFVEECRREYSLVIFDSCPVMGIADAPMLASLADGTVFVLEANKVPFGQARAAIRRIRMGNGNVIGAVLTKYRALEAGQSYDYQYGYYHYGK